MTVSDVIEALNADLITAAEARNMVISIAYEHHISILPSTLTWTERDLSPDPPS